MAATAIPSTQFVTPKPCISAVHKSSRSSIAYVGNETNSASFTKLRSSSFVPAAQTFFKTYGYKVLSFESHGINAMAASGDKQPLPGLPIDLRGWTFLCFSFIISFLTMPIFRLLKVSIAFTMTF